MKTLVLAGAVFSAAFSISAQPRILPVPAKPGLHGRVAELLDITPANAVGREVKGWREAAWRNERVNGQFVIWSGDAVTGMKCSVSGLKAEDGSVIPASAMSVRRVRSAENGTANDLDRGPLPNLPANSCEVLWFTVCVPKNAVPATYRGTLQVSADGGKTLEFPLLLEVRYDVLPDSGEWKCLPGVWQRALSAAGTGIKPFSKEFYALMAPVLAVIAPEKGRAADTVADGCKSSLECRDSVSWEIAADLAENVEKAYLLKESRRTMWQMDKAIDGVAGARSGNADSKKWHTVLTELATVVDAVSAPAELNGRKVDCEMPVWGSEYGYEKPVRVIQLVQHPVASMDRPGRPLYVILHSAGHNAALAMNCLRYPDNHPIYRAPDDFFALYLDCRMVGSDWWWGYNSKHGFDLSPCEKRLLATIERTIVKYGCDRDRVYLCGNSMGGSGTLGFGLRHGNIFAAAKANVPAWVEHACDRMGWPDGVPAGAVLPDPPVLVDYTAPNDKKWSTGHENLIKMMRERKYPLYLYWGPYAHANRNAKVLALNDLVHTLDWTSIRKSDMYAVFTDGSCDSRSPWPDNRDSREAGQINAFFRWKGGSDNANGAKIGLYLADLKSAHFTVPTEASATVTLRRMRNFRAKPGETLKWSFRGRNGNIVVGPDGTVTVPGLVIAKEAAELSVTR